MFTDIPHCPLNKVSLMLVHIVKYSEGFTTVSFVNNALAGSQVVSDLLQLCVKGKRETMKHLMLYLLTLGLLHPKIGTL